MKMKKRVLVVVALAVCMTTVAATAAFGAVWKDKGTNVTSFILSKSPCSSWCSSYCCSFRQGRRLGPVGLMSLRRIALFFSCLAWLV